MTCLGTVRLIHSWHPLVAYVTTQLWHPWR
nr:MAG TPA: hypothetical protein [Caudoviricetes sp.]